MGFYRLCGHLLKKKLSHSHEKSCICLVFWHVALIVAQIAGFLWFCREKKIDLCFQKSCKKQKKQGQGCGCDQDGNRTDQAGVADAARPPECDGITTAEGQIGDNGQTAFPTASMES